MIYVVSALIILLLVALFFLRLVRGHDGPLAEIEELQGLTRPIDMDALSALLDPADAQFLARNLSPINLRTLQRQRTLAITDYVHNIAHNAGLLVRLGQVARANPNPQIALAAQAMVERALHVRMVAMLVLVKLYARSLVPVLPLTAEEIFRDYRSLTETALLYTRLQRPAFAGRMGAML